MGMRLLPKKEISVLQASKTKAEIDEGLKLARRVDSLREIVADEEASLASFRDATLKAIQADIKKVEQERNEVKGEVETLRSELEQSTKQLDIRENAVKEREEALKQHQSALNERLGGLKTLLEEIKKLSTESGKYHRQCVSTVTLIDQVRLDTDVSLKEAQYYLNLSTDNYKSVCSLVEQVQAELKTRDIELASKERDATIRSEHLDVMSKSLHTKELQLIDREQTLEREFNRLNKKYGS